MSDNKMPDTDIWWDDNGNKYIRADIYEASIEDNRKKINQIGELNDECFALTLELRGLKNKIEALIENWMSEVEAENLYQPELDDLRKLLENKSNE